MTGPPMIVNRDRSLRPYHYAVPWRNYSIEKLAQSTFLFERGRYPSCVYSSLPE